MSDKLSFWGDGIPILIPDKSTGGMDYWGDGEPSPNTALMYEVQTLTPEGIASEEAFGSPAVTNSIASQAINLLNEGIPTEEAVGEPRLAVGPVTVQPTGIVSEEDFGTAEIQPGPVTLSPSGIVSEEACGEPRLGEVIAIVPGYLVGLLVEARSYFLQPLQGPRGLLLVQKVLNILTSISGYDANRARIDLSHAIQYAYLGYYYSALYTTWAINDLTYRSEEYPGGWAVDWCDSGIPSKEAVGVPVVTAEPVIRAISIPPSDEYFPDTVGAPTILPGPVLIDLDDEGIESLQAVGRPTVQPGSTSVYPESIATAEAFGTAKVTSAIKPEAIPSEEAVGEPALTCGPVDVRPAAIVTQEAVGMPVLGLNITRLIGVESEEAFGNTQVLPGPVDLVPVGIVTQEAAGTPQLNFGMHPGGIASEEAFGNPQLNLVIFPEGIASKERFGPNSKFKCGPVSIWQRSIPSEEMVGQPYIKRPERTDLITLEVNFRDDLFLVAGVFDLDLYRARLEAVELIAGAVEIDLHLDEREVVNG